jgi:hypothetical protein
LCCIAATIRLAGVTIRVENVAVSGTRPHHPDSAPASPGCWPSAWLRFRASARSMPLYRRRSTAFGHLEYSSVRIRLRTSLYRRGSVYPLARTDGEGDSTEDLYRLVERCVHTLAASLPGIPRTVRGPRGLDLVFCINLSGSMASLAPDLRRGMLETLNMLERTVPLPEIRIALLLYRVTPYSARLPLPQTATPSSPHWMTQAAGPPPGEA